MIPLQYFTLLAFYRAAARFVHHALIDVGGDPTAIVPLWYASLVLGVRKRVWWSSPRRKEEDTLEKRTENQKPFPNASYVQWGEIRFSLQMV